MATIETRVDDHEKRINQLEVNTAVLSDNVQKINRGIWWGITILGGSFLLQLASLVIKQ